MDRDRSRRFLRSPVFLALSLAALTVLTYWRAPGTEFIGDDFPRIVMNEHFLEQGFLESITHILPDRPFLTSTIFINYSLGGINPRGYKVFSLALHIMTGIAFFVLLLRMQKRVFSETDPIVPAILAAVFLTHPLNSQAIMSSIQRGVILAALGGIGSFLFFLEYLATGKRVLFLLSLLCYTLGILSKSFVVCVPLIMLLYLWCSGRSVGPFLGRFFPFLLITILPVIPYHFWGVNRQEGSSVLRWHEYLLVQSRAIWIYLKLFLIPTNLHFYYRIDPNPSFWSNFTWLAVSGHGIVIFSGVALARHRLLIGFGILAMYLAFLPESGFFAIRDLVFEHRAYFPMLFFLLALFAVVRTFQGVARLTVLFFLPVILLFSLMTNARIGEIGTSEKWVLNSYRHIPSDHVKNLQFLNALLAAKSTSSAQGICRTMIEDDPAFTPYSLFLKIFSYPEDDRQTRKETVELIGTALLKKNKSQIGDQNTVRNFLSFLMNNSMQFAPDPLTLQKNLEPVLKNQLQLFLSNNGYFFRQIQFHQYILAQLKGHFESVMAKGEIPDRDFAQYLSVLGQLSVYYPDRRAELAGKAGQLRIDFPRRAAQVDASEEYYQKLQRRLAEAGQLAEAPVSTR